MQIIGKLNKNYNLLNFVRFCSSHQVKMNFSDPCNIAVCQLTCSNDKVKNLAVVKSLVAEAVKKQAKIVFFPEATDYIATSKEENKSLAEGLDGSLIKEYKDLAVENDVWLSIGGMHEVVKCGNDVKMHNCHVMIDNKGEIKSIYRKLHLFDVSIPEQKINLRESDYIMPGNNIVEPVGTPAGLVGLSICYDLRFPELSNILRQKGAEFLTFPSAFTNSTGQAHWEVLLRSRAIENQCYVIAAAQYGEHNKKRISFGQAMIVDPWGKILAECPKYSEKNPTNESVAVATVSRNLVAKIRKEMPVFNHRRNDLYDLNFVNNVKDSCTAEGMTFKFANKEIPPETVFYVSKHSYAFTNIRCVVPGHVLVTSIRPAKRLQDLSSVEVSDFFQTTVRVQKAIESQYGADSSTICVQDGKEAGQTMPHVHVHIMPRKQGDFSKNDEVYLKLAQHDRDANPDPMRSLDDMAREAQILKKYF